MSPPRQAVVVCEGYYDRSFWKGWLVEGLGCRSMDFRGAPKDPSGKSVGQGQFGFYSPSEALFIRVVPCHGDKKKIEPTAKRYLEELDTKPLTNLVINIDVDTSPAGPAHAVDVVRTLVNAVYGPTKPDNAGDFIVGPDATRVSSPTLVPRHAWQGRRPNRTDPRTAGV
jgi:hypothetical protein